MSNVNKRLLLKKQAVLEESYRKILESAEIFANDLCFKIMDLLKQNMLNEFFSLSHDSLLRTRDEEIFDDCKYIYSLYKKALNLYELNKEKIITDNKIEILDGIASIFESRLESLGDNNLFSGENPITKEKIKIILESVRTFEVYFDKKREFYFKNNFQSMEEEIKNIFCSENNEEKSSKLFDLISNDLHKNFMPKIFNGFVKEKDICLVNINDLDKRKITTAFLEIIKEEQEILSSIIRIQVIFLEKVNHETEVSEETEAINNILVFVREAYQYISKKVSTLGIILSEAGKNNEPKKTADEYIEESLDYIKTQSNSVELGLSEFDELFFDRINDFYATLTDEIIFFTRRKIKEASMEAKAYYRERAYIANKISRDIMKAIKVLINFYNHNKSSLEEQKEDFEIIDGINETMIIKIDSMEESIFDFSKNIIDLLENFNKVKMEITETETDTLINDIKNIWVFNYKNHKDRLLQRTLRSIFNNENYQKIKMKTERQLVNKKENTDKYIIQYKKSYVLYEIVTFEEIEKYSIERIKDSESEMTKKYVEVFKKASVYINDVLKENNIKRIIPMPHDLFNAAEHEILMAEKNEEFNKGEIIKVNNSGFKEDDLIYIRANVIAAK